MQWLGALLRTPSLTPDGRLLLGARAMRTFAFGFLSVVLALYLAGHGLSATQIGAVLTATLVEDALATALLTSVADRWGRRRLLRLAPLMMTAAGVGLAMARSPAVLILAAVLGTISPSGVEAGPFLPLEQAALPETVPAATRTLAYSWYNVAGSLGAALGALAAGMAPLASRPAGLTDLQCWRASSGPTRAQASSCHWPTGASRRPSRRGCGPGRGRPRAGACTDPGGRWLSSPDFRPSTRSQAGWCCRA